MPRLDTTPGQSKRARDEIDLAPTRARETAELGRTIERRLATSINIYLRADTDNAERLGSACAVDLHAAGYSPIVIAERMNLPVAKARELLANGLNALNQRAAVSAEIIRTSASEQLDSLYADLAELRRGDLDQSASIRAIEVQARIIQQRVSLYGAQVRETDNDLQTALQDLLQRKHQADADTAGLPALTLTPEPASDTHTDT